MGISRRERIIDDDTRTVPRRSRGRRSISLFSILVIIWLVIGAVAAYQRGYFESTEQNCASAATTAITVVAGPLNYLGVNPKVSDCNVPKPSQ